MLSIDEREEISRGIAAGGSLRSIAAKLRRAPSTISCELRSNGGLGHCSAAAADQRARQTSDAHRLQERSGETRHLNRGMNGQIEQTTLQELLDFR